MAEGLADWLQPDERIIVASGGVHPLAFFAASFWAVFTAGFALGVLVANLVDSGIVLFVVLVAVLAGWWYYLLRYRSEEQPAGLEPLVGLTNRRLVYANIGRVSRRPTAIFDVSLPDIASFNVSRWAVFMPLSQLTTSDGTIVRYRILHARRIDRELLALSTGGRGGD